MSATGSYVAPNGGDVFVVIDLQNDFVPGGALAVAEGDLIVPLINRLAARFAHVVVTQDWHPPRHSSFASSHPGMAPFATIELAYGSQVLWPDHCVQGSAGAELVAGLRIPQAELVLRKGYRREVDSYSAFNEADGAPTGLAAYLRERRLGRVFLAGLATDFCVGWSAIGARQAGFETFVIEDACRAIDADGSLARAWADMAAAGVGRIRSHDLALPAV
jgi:nicotinamidase/pyrazinamidase